MKSADLRGLTDAELAARVEQLRRAVFDTKIQHETQQLADTSKLQSSKRVLARALTIERERSRKA